MLPPTPGAEFQIGRHGNANDQSKIKNKKNLFNQNTQRCEAVEFNV
jgi:hypothetical protein